MKEIQNMLFAMQDLEYKAFHSRLMPTVAADTVIGVRTPALRAFAKQLSKTEQAEAFLLVLPHTYYEENNLHAFLIAQIKDYDACIAALQNFLPYIDNWATCDMLRPHCFKKHKAELLQEIQQWLHSPHPYTVRFGLGMLMVHFLEEAFEPKYLQWAAEIESEEYYINMMTAWYFATALAKQWEQTLPFLKESRLTPWVHQKTIQKAVESNRITIEKKQYLRSLRIQWKGRTT